MARSGWMRDSAGRAVIRVAAASGLLLPLAFGCAQPPGAAAPQPRFELVALRTAGAAVRADRSRGTAWVTGIGDGGEWRQIDEIVGTEPETSSGGPGTRYRFRVVSVGQYTVLFRIDGKTGQSWRNVIGSTGPWVLVPPALAADYAVSVVEPAAEEEPAEASSSDGAEGAD